MKQRLHTAILLIALLLFYNCSSNNDDSTVVDENGEVVATQLELSTYAVEFELAGGTEKIAIKSNGTWKISELPSWVTLSPETGTSSTGVVTTEAILTVQPSSDVKRRELVIQVTGGEISKELSIIQKEKLVPKEGELVVDEYTGEGIAILKEADTLEEMIEAVENKEIITSLKILGQIGNSDILSVNALTELSTLDMSEGSAINETWEPNLLTSESTVTKLRLPKNLKTISKGAFENNTSLVEIILPLGLEQIEDEAFKKTMSLKKIHIPSTVHTLGTSVFESSYLSNIEFGEDINHRSETGNGASELTRIAPKTFLRCNNLQYVYIPKKVISIGERAFNECNIIGFIGISEAVRTIDQYAFADCKYLSSIEIPASVETMGNNLFSGCTRLKSVLMRNSPTVIPSAMFLNCETLQIINIPESVTRLESKAFSGCKRLEDITLPANLITIGSSRGRNYDGQVFFSCSSLKMITLPKTLRTIGENTFGYTSLEEITIPEEVNYLGTGAFWKSASLKTVTFEGDLPRKIHDSETIFQLTNLRTVYLKKEEPQTIMPTDVRYLFSDEFSNTVVTEETGTIYVPKGSLEKYKAHDFWKNYNLAEE